MSQWFALPAALILVGMGAPAPHAVEGKSTSEIELKVEGNRHSFIYKGKKELHQVTGVVTFICQGGFMTMPRQQLWTTWKPGKAKVVFEDRAKPDQVQLDCIGHRRLVDKDTTSPKDYQAVPLRVQWDAATGKEVLFVDKKPKPSEEDFFSVLQKDQEVALEDTPRGYRINSSRGVRHNYKVVRIGKTYAVLKALGDKSEIRIPFHAVKEVVRSADESK